MFPAVVNGSVDGCSVYDSGSVQSSVRFGNNFSICLRAGNSSRADAAAGNDVALVVVGAWDVFDIDDNGTIYGFATPEGDALFVRNLSSGIDTMLAEGASVGLARSRLHAALRTSKARASGRCPSAATTAASPTSTTCFARPLPRTTRRASGSSRVPTRCVQRRGDRHRPRLPRRDVRPRLQARCQSDLRDRRSGSPPPRCGLTPTPDPSEAMSLARPVHAKLIACGSGHRCRAGSRVAAWISSPSKRNAAFWRRTAASCGDHRAVRGWSRRHRLDGDRI